MNNSIFSGLTSIEKQLKNMSKVSCVIPKLDFIDPKTVMLCRIQQNITEMKKDNKNSFWKNLFNVLIGAIVGAVTTCLLSLIL